MGSVSHPSGLEPPTVGQPGVYIVPVDSLSAADASWTIVRRPIRAWAPHPDIDDLVYVTTEAPDTLGFLPGPVYELD